MCICGAFQSGTAAPKRTSLRSCGLLLSKVPLSFGDRCLEEEPGLARAYKRLVAQDAVDIVQHQELIRVPKD